MKIQMMRFMALAVATVMAVSVFAQGGQGQGRGQGQGGGRQGQGMGGRMMGGQQGGIQSLLRRADVQKDLKLTDEQKAAIRALDEKMGTELRNSMQNGGGDPTQLRAMMEEMQKKNAAETEKILTEDQRKRILEIQIQVEGNRALLDLKVQRALGLSETQIKKLQNAQTAQQTKQRDMMQAMREQQMTREQIQAEQTKMQQDYDKELGAILTEDQSAKFKAMAGAKFEADPNQGRGGFGGGGFGGGRPGGQGGPGGPGFIL